jgi:ribosomal protein S27E
MIVIFETTQEFSAMKTIVKEFEASEFKQNLSEDSVFDEVLINIKKELNIQKYTSLGYKTKHLKCKSCELEWQAFYEKGASYVECPNCRNVIVFDKSSERRK